MTKQNLGDTLDDFLEKEGLLTEVEETALKRAKMSKYTDSLRGYAFEVLKRDGFKCRYCGLDGTQSFDVWLTLSWDHLLPKGHPKRDNPDFIVAACNFCNSADNRYFDLVEKRGLKLDGLTPDELVEQRKRFVEKTRASYFEFWKEHVTK
ncbi:MAG: HNH endonuclease [Anaerolineales bacterium]|nr:HNH endonuclease [Anaerolineales bacterium]